MGPTAVRQPEGAVRRSALTLFAVTAPGLAPFCALEFSRLGLCPEPPQVEVGGVEVVGDLHTLYQANLHLRTASRLLVRLGEFHAENFAQLRMRAAQLGWEHYLHAGQPVDLRVTCHRSRLYHSDAVAERIAVAIGDRLGICPERHKGDEEGEGPSVQQVVVRLVQDRCTVSVDSSGSLLHRRGYRLATAKAPLRETLAAGLVLAAGWEGAESPPLPLVDPFCGSGTIAIEAAQLALQLAPGRQRSFAFLNWPGFDAQGWQRLLAEADLRAQLRSAQLAGRVFVYASDRDAGAVRAAQANAERAGVSAAVALSCRPLSAVEPPEGVGCVVTNPPYGRRVQGGRDLRNLYAQLGHVLRQRCPGWELTLLCGDRLLLGQVGLPLESRLHFNNGGLSVFVARGRVQSSDRPSL